MVDRTPLERGLISEWQLAALVAGFCLADALVLGPGREVKQDAWLAVAAGTFLGLLLAAFYAMVGRLSPQGTFVEALQHAFGSFLGKAISLAFLWFCLQLASIILVIFGQFCTSTIMPRTPEGVFIIGLAMVSVMCAREGIEVIGRCGMLLFFLSVIVVLASTTFSLKVFEPSNLLPILEAPPIKLISAIISVGAFPFGEIVVFLMVAPFVSRPGARAGVGLAKGAALCGFLLTVATVRNTGVLGSMSGVYFFPSYQAIRLANLAPFLSRVEIFVVIAFVAMGFIKLSVLVYAFSLGLAQTLNLRSYRPMVAPAGALMALMAMHTFRNVPEMFLGQRVWPFYSLPFAVGLPMLALGGLLLRRRINKGKPG